MGSSSTSPVGVQPGNKCSLLRSNEVDSVYVEPFILSGYRPPRLSWWQCMEHAFVLHNDVGNFWTHFVPFLVWVWWLVGIAVSHENFFQPYYYPMMCFWAGACSYALFSSLAHMFSCKSFLVRTVCFLLDYLGIAMYALGADIASLYYLSSVSSPLLRYTRLFIWLEVLFAVLATFMCSLTRFYWRKFRFAIRTGCYVIPYLFALFPYLHRQYQCIAHGADCVPETFALHMAAVALVNLLAFFFVSKVPERFFPGRFDYLFQSHQLFHVCAAALTTTQMYFLPLEVALRREVLLSAPGGSPSWNTTFLPFGTALVLGVMVVVALGYLTSVGLLTTNKHGQKKEQ